MSLDALAQLVVTLRTIEVPQTLTEGICGNVGRAIHKAGHEWDRYPTAVWLRVSSTKWPKYSGYSYYPVPHPTMQAVTAYHTTHNLWEGEYGAARQELREFLLERAKRQLRGCVFLEALLDLRNRVIAGHPVANAGICHATRFENDQRAVVVEVQHEWLWWVPTVVREWPEFAGSMNYPVPFGGDVPPKRAYWNAHGNGTLWDCSTPYGAARRRLLDFLIERAAKEANGDF